MVHMFKKGIGMYSLNYFPSNLSSRSSKTCLFPFFCVCNTELNFHGSNQIWLINHITIFFQAGSQSMIISQLVFIKKNKKTMLFLTTASAVFNNIFNVTIFFLPNILASQIRISIFNKYLNQQKTKYLSFFFLFYLSL